MAKIMVVDDEPDTLELAKTVLELDSFEVNTFSSSLTAFDELKKGNLPDLIVLDMRMPELAGPEFCEQVRKDEKLKHLKIVYFTASSEKSDPNLQRHGVLGYIFKPFDNDKFIEEVKKYISM